MNFTDIQNDLESGIFYQKDILIRYNMSIKKLKKFAKMGLLDKNKWNLKKYKVSDETRNLISDGRKKWLSENLDKHPWRNKNKSKPCEEFKRFLKSRNIDFVEEVMISKDRFYSVDILIPEHGSVVEINGNQHYDILGNLKDYYKKRNEYIENLGWRIFEIHYSIVYKQDLCELLLEKIKDGESVDLKFYIKIKKERKYKNRTDYWANRKKLKLDKYKEKLNRLKNSNIDFKKLGWVKMASNILEVKNPGKLLMEIDPDFYKECYKR